MRAAPDILHDPVHFLRPVAHADGKYQERHENGIGTERIAEHGQQAQQPNHRDERTEDNQERAAYTSGMPIEQGACNEDRDGKERQQNLHPLD